MCVTTFAVCHGSDGDINDKTHATLRHGKPNETTCNVVGCFELNLKDSTYVFSQPKSSNKAIHLEGGVVIHVQLRGAQSGLHHYPESTWMTGVKCSITRSVFSMRSIIPQQKTDQQRQQFNNLSTVLTSDEHSCDNILTSFHGSGYSTQAVQAVPLHPQPVSTTDSTSESMEVGSKKRKRTLTTGYYCNGELEPNELTVRHGVDGIPEHISKTRIITNGVVARTTLQHDVILTYSSSSSKKHKNSVGEKVNVTHTHVVGPSYKLDDGQARLLKPGELLDSDHVNNVAKIHSSKMNSSICNVETMDIIHVSLVPKNSSTLSQCMCHVIKTEAPTTLYLRGSGGVRSQVGSYQMETRKASAVNDPTTLVQVSNSHFSNQPIARHVLTCRI